MTLYIVCSNSSSRFNDEQAIVLNKKAFPETYGVTESNFPVVWSINGLVEKICGAGRGLSYGERPENIFFDFRKLTELLSVAAAAFDDQNDRYYGGQNQ